MAKLMKMLQPLESEYVDRRFDGSKEEYFQQLGKSSTLYIGNLSFYTTEDQIYELFSKVGVVQRVIMGLDRNNKTPCGFCFVIYHRRQDALAAVRYLNGTKLDNRQLRVDVDYGFEEGRQFGRGRSGGQVRDEFRMDYDADRGGYGRVMAQQLSAQSNAMWQQVQLGAGMGPAVGAAAVNPMYFGQQQRGAGQLQQQQQQQPAVASAAAGDEEEPAAEDDDQVAINPKLKGRGAEADEEDYLHDGSGPRKRQRLTVTEPDGDAAGAEQYAEQQQQSEDGDQASQEQDDAEQ